MHPLIVNNNPITRLINYNTMTRCWGFDGLTGVSVTFKVTKCASSAIVQSFTHTAGTISTNIRDLHTAGTISTNIRDLHTAGTISTNIRDLHTAGTISTNIRDLHTAGTISTNIRDLHTELLDYSLRKITH